MMSGNLSGDTVWTARDWMQVEVVESDSPESVTLVLGYH